MIRADVDDTPAGNGTALGENPTSRSPIAPDGEPEPAGAMDYRLSAPVGLSPHRCGSASVPPIAPGKCAPAYERPGQSRPAAEGFGCVVAAPTNLDWVETRRGSGRQTSARPGDLVLRR